MKKYGESLISREKWDISGQGLKKSQSLISQKVASEQEFTSIILFFFNENYHLPVSLKLLKNHRINQLRKLTGPQFPDQGETDKQIMQHKVMYYPFFQYCKDAMFLRASCNKNLNSLETKLLFHNMRIHNFKISLYPGELLPPPKGLKQDLVRTDDSFPCLDLLSFHEKLVTSTEFRML